jgi:hypothetical protein
MSTIHTRSIHILAVGGLILSAGPAQAGDPLFDAPWRSFTTGDFPTFAPSTMDKGDIDGDGDNDIVAGFDFFGAPGISVLKSNGDGSYLPPVIYETGYNRTIGEVALADIDGDGDLDAVASIPDANGLTNRLALWRNNGVGAFGARVEFNAGPGPMGIAVADFTGDGFPDVVTCNNGYVAGTENTISLLRHNGQSGSGAGFLAPVNTVVGDNCLRVAAADIDGDGDLDIAVGRVGQGGVGDDSISVLRNNGTGGFGSIVNYDPAPGAYVRSPAVVLADMNNDGDPDLVTSGAQNGGSVYGMVVIRLNNGSGTFGSPLVLQLADWTYNLNSIGVADLNSDGWLDAFGSHPSGRANDGYSVLLSNGSGGFQSVSQYEAGKMTQDLLADDADGDGDLDVLTVANDSSVVTMHRNQGDGSFLVLERYDAGVFAGSIDQGDLDLDGDLDLIASTSSRVYVYANSGNGTFTRTEWATPMQIGETILRDLNNDGYLDLVMADTPNAPPYHFATALNNGNGTFATGVITQVGACQAGQIEAVDLNNDGLRDIALTEPGACGGGTESHIFIARNNGNGNSFTIVNAYETLGGLPWRIGAADFNNDGNMDLMSSLSIGLSVITGNGDFTFDAEIPTSAEGAFDFEVVDLNGDGDEDVAYIVPQDSFGTVYAATMRSYGDGSFAFPAERPVANGREGAFRIVSDIQVGDVTGDGIIDIVTANNAPNDISVLTGNGDTTMQAVADRYGMGYSVHAVALGDYNGDGRQDVAGLISLPPSGTPNALVVMNGVEPGGSQSEIASLSGLGINTGTRISGNRSSLEQDDDRYLKVQSEVVTSGAKWVQITVTATSPHLDISRLDLAAVTRSTMPGVTARVWLRNWNTNRWDLIEAFSQPTTDTLRSWQNIASPDAYVRDSDGRMQARIRMSKVTDHFESWFDLVRFEVTR